MHQRKKKNTFTETVEVVMVEIVTSRAFGSLPTGSVIRVGASATNII